MEKKYLSIEIPQWANAWIEREKEGYRNASPIQKKIADACIAGIKIWLIFSIVILLCR